jgi:hypothetical protein
MSVSGGSLLSRCHFLFTRLLDLLRGMCLGFDSFNASDTQLISLKSFNSCLENPVLTSFPSLR